MKKTKKGQSLSFDAITATAMFVILLIIAILYYYNLNQGGIQQTLTQEAIVISQNLLSSNQPHQSIIEMGVLDDAKIVLLMERLLNAPDNPAEYQKIKLEFGIRDDFCIYLEDEDGNLIMLQVNDRGSLELAPAIFGSSRAEYITNGRPIYCNVPRQP